MRKILTGWLNIYEKEISLFLWTLALLFIVRSSGIILNNYAETAFLKRYGVEFLPIVNMINAVATVVVMGFVAGLMQKYPGPRLLGGMFIFSGASIMGLRLVIPLGIDLVYPILFMLKAQFEVLLAMLFWNLANDLFNTRQSKRLFPLITAGGVVGLILGSFGTPWMVRWLQFDNLLVVYLGISLVGAGVVWGMMRRFPTLLMADTQTKSSKARTSMVAEIRAVWPMMKESVLLRIMIMLTLMPNVVIPILNYQFNYAVDSQFASESGLLVFFGYFRGVLNIVNLIILLFVGKIYGRWGLPVALMFHPFNYVLAFMAFLFRFDALTAIYARMSTNIIRSTINIPANAIMMGLFPESFRAMVRPFLRGTVVRIALFLGSFLILISDQLFHPRYLSLVALPFVLAWMVTPFILKRKYAGILLELISTNRLDFKSMEESDMGQLFRDRATQKQLMDAFSAARTQDVLWYAGILQRLKLPDLDSLLIQRINDVSNDQQVELLKMLSPDTPAQALPVLATLAANPNPRLTLAALKAVRQMVPEASAGFDWQPYLNSDDPQIRAQAVMGMLAHQPDSARETIRTWLEDPDFDIRKSGIIAAGLSREEQFIETLKAYLSDESSIALLPETITALHNMGVHDLNPIMAYLLNHDNLDVRRAALGAYHIEDKKSLKIAIALLADPNPTIRKIAADRIETAEFQDGKTLIKALNTPNKEMRENLFDLLDRLQIKDLDVFRYARNQIEGAYKYIAESQGVQTLTDTPGRGLLLDHLEQQRWGLLENVLRVLTIQDHSGRMRVACRGVLSNDPRQRANSQEALDDLLDHSLSKILAPLLDDAPEDRMLSAGRKQFKLPDYTRDADALCNHLLQRNEWLTVLLTLQLISELENPPVEASAIKPLLASSNAYIRQQAMEIEKTGVLSAPEEERDMTATLTLPQIILRLKNIEIFEQLSVAELAAVASVTEEVNFSEGQVVIKEGDPGDTLYLVVEGQVAVLKKQEDDREIELDQIKAGDYFGEMALFEDIPRTATIQTKESCRMLMLHKQEFKEMVREYPQIALQICKALSGRIRVLHTKMSEEIEAYACPVPGNP